MGRPVIRYPGMRADAPQAPLDAAVAVRGDVAALAALVGAGGTLVLSGAGLSTDSGIPDYRGPTSRRRRHAPMTYDAFVTDPAARHRYWARSHVGWPRIAAAAPNDGHGAVTTLQRAGLLRGVITQNVDGLHRAAGARDVVELHGALDRVACLGCGARLARRGVHERLRRVNREFDALVDAAVGINPDGDAELPDDALARFEMIGCPACGGGPLKPDVVFFGEPVPRPRVTRSSGLLAGARALLVLGSSLTVMSGLRFVHAARRAGTPVAMVTTGPSRGDDAAAIRLDGSLGTVLPAVLSALGLDHTVPEAPRPA